MEHITFTCRVITPMFLAGADGSTPELRAPSIKGAMRFWWRALHGHLPLKELKEREAAIFGGSGDKVSRSKITIRTASVGELITTIECLVPHKSFMKAPAIEKGQMVKVHLSIVSNTPEDVIDKAKLVALFELTCLLGGWGKRVRRGMGSLNIESVEGSEEANYPLKADIKHIYKLVSLFSPFYQISSNGSIHFSYPGRTEKYGFIQQIELGKPTDERLLREISDATHTVKSRDSYAYEASMGHAYKGRYASPVYVSVVAGSLCPIITTLNLAPDKNEQRASLGVQEDFKSKIMRQ